MKKLFLKSAKIALVLVYLVIIAGALVRMTGSGMGCPDWPKCFGYYIPPTEKSELLFTPKKEYSKGQVIIKDETLLVVKEDFVAQKEFNAVNWEKYAKHDYAVFNPLHTWVEYINRLCGALAGLACFATFLLSFSFWKERKSFVLFSLLICVLMGFQAWLGKTVVDSVLNPYKITIHMLTAFIIVGMQLYLIYKVSKKEDSKFVYNSKFHQLIIVVLALTVIQVVLGTSVREHIDQIGETGAPKIMWLQSPTLNFYIHRSFSILVLLANLYLFTQNRKLILGYNKINWVIGILFFEILSGITMAYFEFPFGSQTVHIVLASILFGIQFYLLLETKKSETA